MEAPFFWKRCVDRRAEYATTPRGKSNQAELAKAHVELAAGPCVGRGVGDLLRRELARGPVGGLGALRDAKAEKERGQVAQPRLLEAFAPRRLAEVDDRALAEREHLLQRAQ